MTEANLPQEKPALSWTGLVMMGILISTATGFVREAVIANYYGASRLADIYLVAFSIPEFLFNLFTTVIGASLIPVFVQRQRAGGERAAWSFLGALELSLTLVLVVGATLGMAFAPLYVPLLAPGFAAVDLERTVELSRIMFPALVLMGVSATVSAVLNIYRRFSLPGLAVAAYNTAFVGTAILLKDTLGISSLAWGVMVGAGAQLAIQVPQLLGHRQRALPFDMREPGVRQFFKLASLLAVGYGIHAITIIVDRMMASNLEPGSIASLNYGYRITLLVGQLAGMAVATAYFPTLSQVAAADDKARLRSFADRALRLTLLLGMPAMMGLALLRAPVVKLFFQRGEFGAEATAIAASLVLLFALGTLADALCQPLWRVFYAQQKAFVVILVNSVKTILRIALNIAFIPFLAERGIALSFTIGLTLQLVILMVLLSRQLGTIVGREMAGFVFRVALATGIMGVAVFGASVQTERWLQDNGLALQIVLLIALSLSGLGIYVAAGYRLRVKEIVAAADSVFARTDGAWARLRGMTTPRQEK